MTTSSSAARSRLPNRFSVARSLAACLVLSLLSVSNVSAQQRSILGGIEPAASYPSSQYYTALEIYRTGDLEAALEMFEQAMRRTRRDVNGQWIDAIPVHAMQAECYWQLGNLPACRASLDRAMQIAIRYRGWLAQPDWQSAMRGNVAMAPERGLWPEAAAVRRVPLTDQMMFRSGAALTEQRILRGGAIEEPNIKQVDVIELMRGLAVVSYRRRTLFGPLSGEEPLATQLLEATKYPSNVQLPLARTLIGSMRSIERFATREDSRVIEEATATSTAGGGVHPLTPVALLSAASAFAGGADAKDAKDAENKRAAGRRLARAVAVATQAANAAAALGQPEWIGPAMQLAAGCAGPQQAASVRGMAEKAATAMVRESRLASLHCLIAAADAATTAGQLSDAAQLLGNAKSIASRRDVLQPRLDAYWGYVAARVATASGEPIGSGSGSGVDNALAVLNNFAFNTRFRGQPIVSMPRIYQLELLRQALGEAMGGNRQEKLLEAYCKDPPGEAWRRDPADALASAMHDRSAAEAAWIEMAAVQTDGAELLRRVDFVLGSRFLRRLPLAGRLAQIRQLASAGEPMLFGEAKRFRADPPAAFAELRQAIAGPNAAAPGKLEAAASRVALERLSLPRTMPPPMQVADAGQALPTRTAMLTFFPAGNRIHATLAANGKTAMWTIPAVGRIPREIAALLRGIGVGRTRGKRLPENEDWKEAATRLRSRLVPDEATLTGDRFDELIVVPGGQLWYVPFETLPIGEPDGPLMGDVMRVRYAATPGLALHPVAPPATSRAIGVVAGSYFAPRDKEANRRAVDSIVEAVDDAIRLPGDNPVSGSLLGESIGHLLVATPQPVDASQPLSLGVAGYDAGTRPGTLASWIRFPAQAPRSVILAGFRSPVGLGSMGSGEEIFTTICGLHAAGVRDVMLSRWAVGGQSTAVAMRELLQELPYAGMVDAWHRARGLLMQSEIDPAAEPLLMQSEHRRQGLTGRQPLFWAGYLVASPLGSVAPADAGDDKPPEANPNAGGGDRPGGNAID